MLTLVKAGAHDKQLDNLVDSWFNQTPTATSDDLQAIERESNVEPASAEENAGGETTEVGS